MPVITLPDFRAAARRPVSPRRNLLAVLPPFLAGEPDYSRSAFLVESNGRDFSLFEIDFLAKVAALIRVYAKHPDLVRPAVEDFPFKKIIDHAVQRDMAGMQRGNMPGGTGRA